MLDNIELRSQIFQIVSVLEQKGIVIPNKLRNDVEYLKTVTYYLQALQRAIRDLYNSGDVGKYIDTHARLIREQFTRAWNEGIRAVDMDPEDMTDEEKQALADEIDHEDDFVLDFADEIITARENDTGAQPYLSRAQTWANRYNDIVNKAKLMADKDQKLEWVLGDAEHCKSCIKLNGIVKRASQWQKAGVQPQNAPNEKLECKGYNCKCTLQPTNKPVRRGKLPNLP
jgi:hypothetical protein